MSDRWQGRSQVPGRKRFGARWTMLVPRSWGVAAAVFMSSAVMYGLSSGGYFGRSADFAARKMSTIMVSVGFRVARVTIEGQNRVSNQDIMWALQLERSASTLGFETAAAQKRLEKLPMIRSARIMRLLPSQLHIVLEERVPYAIWQHKSALHLVDQDGTILENLKTGPGPKLPLVVGAGAGKNARDLLDELAHWPKLKAKVQASIRVADRRWNLKLLNGLEIRLPEEDIASALKKVAELDRSQKILSSGGAIAVDLRLSDRVTIRMDKKAAPRRDSALTGPRGKSAHPGRDA